MHNTVYAITAAAIIAACLVVFPSLSPQVEARAPLPVAKSDRLDPLPLGGDCAKQAWPYYTAACLRDTRNPLGKAGAVRVVSADRL